MLKTTDLILNTVKRAQNMPKTLMFMAIVPRFETV